MGTSLYRTSVTLLALAGGLFSPLTAFGQAQPGWGQPNPQGIQYQPAAQGMLVNGVAVTPQQLTQIGIQPGQIQPGRYWYDAQTGAWGKEGAGAQGFIQPGLRIGGPLSPTASNGRTGIFINGRNLPRTDLDQLNQAVGRQVPAGRYWCRANGDCGLEGNPQPLVNFRKGGSGKTGTGGIPRWGAATVEYQMTCNINGVPSKGWAQVQRFEGTADFWTNDSFEGELSEVKSDGSYSLSFTGAISTPQVTYHFEHSAGQRATVTTGAPQWLRDEVTIQGSPDDRGIVITLDPDPRLDGSGQYDGDKLYCTFDSHRKWEPPPIGDWY